MSSVSSSRWIHYGLSVFLSWSSIERIERFVISFLSYLGIWDPNAERLLHPCSWSTCCQRNKNDTNRVVAQHPIALSLLILMLYHTLIASSSRRRKTTNRSGRLGGYLFDMYETFETYLMNHDIICPALFICCIQQRADRPSHFPPAGEKLWKNALASHAGGLCKPSACLWWTRSSKCVESITHGLHVGFIVYFSSMLYRTLCLGASIRIWTNPRGITSSVA